MRYVAARTRHVRCTECGMVSMGRVSIHSLACSRRTAMFHRPVADHWPRNPAVVVAALLES